MIAPALAACIRLAASTYHVPRSTIAATIAAPKGPDAVGPMGIPPAWLPVLASHGFDPSDVMTDSCDNIRAGAMILAMTPGRRVTTSSEAGRIPASIRAIVLEAIRDYGVDIGRVIAVLHAPHLATSIGPMGIPQVWIPTLSAAGFDTRRLEQNPGYAAAAGVWILGVEHLGRSTPSVHEPAARFSPVPPHWLLSLATPIAREYGVPLALVLAVAAQESGFRPGAVSSAGAVGLMQLMPKTAARFGVRDRRDPAQSLAGGIAYLAHLRSLFAANLPLALAAYNAGSRAVIDNGNRIPPFRETRHYVPAVLARYRYYQHALAPKLVTAATKPVAVASKTSRPAKGVSR